MKIFLSTLVLLLTISISVSQAQLATDSWSFGFGLTYPRFSSVNLQPLNSDYGGYISLGRNFTENMGLRLKAGYYHMQGQWADMNLVNNTETTNLLAGNLDVLYNFIPCATFSPYLFAGGGVALRSANNYPTKSLDENETALSLGVGGGVEWAVASDWKLTAEYGFHTMFNSELDGTVPVGEINGRDSYMTINLGFLYAFGKGTPSKMCEPCLPQGITHDLKDVDYDRIEEMIVKHIPKEIIKEVVVEKYIKAISDDRLVLIGVNFAFDKSDLLPESYPVLDQAVKLLNDKSGINVEIEGYCDYIGSDDYNQKLSVERAQTVKSYLVSKGINAARLTTIGYGKGNPIADNTTEEGRAMNRRIVFRILK